MRPKVKQKDRIRIGRGFSLNELKEAGMNLDIARRLKIPINHRRRSCWSENVKMLKDLSVSAEKIRRKVGEER